MNARAVFIAATAALLLSAGNAMGQSGFALKANTIYNRESIEEQRRIPSAVGIGAGAELVLPGGLGLGVSAYTGGRLSELDRGASSFTTLGEVNYHLRLPLIPISPYAGVHAGLGTYSRADLTAPAEPKVQDDLRQLGYQFGVRIPLGSVIGLDAQFRRVSTWLSGAQDGRIAREQIVLGITLF
jgi:hypothetical protein